MRPGPLHLLSTVLCLACTASIGESSRPSSKTISDTTTVITTSSAFATGTSGGAGMINTSRLRSGATGGVPCSRIGPGHR